MKNFLKVLCAILVISMVLSVPVFAAEETNPWSSAFFVLYSTYLYRTTGTQFEIWFEVDARDVMQELGVNSILLQESSDGENWITVKTYEPEDYPQMICENTGSHAECVSYTGRTGYDYRAYVSFYAKNSSGIGERYVYAYFL